MKMRRLLLSLLVLCTMSAFALTDKQVIDYIKQQTAAGKTQQQISKELLAKGVTPEQAQRIKKQYEEQMNNQSGSSSSSSSKSRSRSRTKGSEDDGNSAVSKNKGKTTTKRKNGRATGTSALENEGGSIYVEDDMMVGEPETFFGFEIMPGEEVGSGKVIFGHDVFSSESLTFEPNENLATPQNYRLGPGDEMVIDVWGASEDHIREVISPEGSIMIPALGPIYLNGLTVNEAQKRIKSTFAQKYAGVADSESDIQVALGQVRTIQVDVMGEVAVPGTFRISPFATVFNALYNAGGINDIGSLRNIQVLRNGKKIAGVDIYDFLFKGKSAGNVRLQEGDVIIVPPYEQLVNIEGNVKRPMYYEIKPGETVENLLSYSGGFTGDAYSGMVRVSRQSGTENELFNVEKSDFPKYKLQDGDLVNVGMILDRFANRVEIKGAVYRPGLYAINRDLSTIGELVRRADGLTEDAYTDRVLLYREGPDLQLQIIALNIADILSGKTPDIELKRNDIIEILTVEELVDKGDLTINGEVAVPGKYPYADNTTLEDLILQAGGLLVGASTARVDVARRIIQPEATDQTEQLAEVFSVAIDGSLSVGSGKGFILHPYDVVTVRTSPGYEEQEFVSVRGNVLFSGQYALQKRNERMSDVVRRAGGVLDGAYVKGARLTRRLTEDEYAARQETLRLAQMNSNAETGDSIALSKITVADHYNVGINLELALQNPGSHYDVVLQPGDEIFVPEEQSTVKILGDVLFQNTVVYEPGKKLKHYVEQAGGYGKQAMKKKVFVVYQNGTVAVGKKNVVIEPGCQIIVPSKPKSTTNWTQIMALATSFASLSTMAATITNLFK